MKKAFLHLQQELNGEYIVLENAGLKMVNKYNIMFGDLIIITGKAVYANPLHILI
jgi:hypothetical protein